MLDDLLDLEYDLGLTRDTNPTRWVGGAKGNKVLGGLMLHAVTRPTSQLLRWVEDMASHHLTQNLCLRHITTAAYHC